jgi:hypothetical protein
MRKHYPPTTYPHRASHVNKPPCLPEYTSLSRVCKQYQDYYNDHRETVANKCFWREVLLAPFSSSINDLLVASPSSSHTRCCLCCCLCCCCSHHRSTSSRVTGALDNIGSLLFCCVLADCCWQIFVGVGRTFCVCVCVLCLSSLCCFVTRSLATPRNQTVHSVSDCETLANQARSYHHHHYRYHD